MYHTIIVYVNVCSDVQRLYHTKRAIKVNITIAVKYLRYHRREQTESKCKQCGKAFSTGHGLLTKYI